MKKFIKCIPLLLLACPLGTHSHGMESPHPFLHKLITIKQLENEANNIQQIENKTIKFKMKDENDLSFIASTQLFVQFTQASYANPQSTRISILTPLQKNLISWIQELQASEDVSSVFVKITNYIKQIKEDDFISKFIVEEGRKYIPKEESNERLDKLWA